MKTIALVAASEFNADDFERRDAANAFDRVIAIDGGFAHLDAIGRAPDVALGDFDSLGYVPECAELLQFPVHKDKSDMELALEYVAGGNVSAFADGNNAVKSPAPAVDESIALYVYGALGGRIDHTLANIQLIARYAEQGMSIALIDQDCMLHFLVGPSAYALPHVKRGVVSVFALTPEAIGVTEKGMEYPLDNATLTNRTTLGLSNELIGKPVTISAEKGTLIVVHPIQ